MVPCRDCMRKQVGVAVRSVSVDSSCRPPPAINFSGEFGQIEINTYMASSLYFRLKKISARKLCLETAYPIFIVVGIKVECSVQCIRDSSLVSSGFGNPVVIRDSRPSVCCLPEADTVELAVIRGVLFQHLVDCILRDGDPL